MKASGRKKAPRKKKTAAEKARAKIRKRIQDAKPGAVPRVLRTGLRTR
jgi:hypothetical protein